MWKKLFLFLLAILGLVLLFNWILPENVESPLPGPLPPNPAVIQVQVPPGAQKVSLLGIYLYNPDGLIVPVMNWEIAREYVQPYTDTIVIQLLAKDSAAGGNPRPGDPTFWLGFPVDGEEKDLAYAAVSMRRARENAPMEVAEIWKEVYTLHPSYAGGDNAAVVVMATATNVPTATPIPPPTAVVVIATPTLVPTLVPTPFPTPILPLQPPVVIQPTAAVVTSQAPASNLPVQPASSGVAGIEVTQGVQVFHLPESAKCGQNQIFCNNNIQMVTGRPTLVRVYPLLGSSLPNLTGQPANLFLDIIQNNAVRQTLNLPVDGGRFEQLRQQSVDKQRLDPKALGFYLDRNVTSSLVGAITFQVRIEDAGVPLTVLGAVAMHFEQRRPLTVWVKPVTVTGRDGKVYVPSTNIDFGYWLHRVLPVPSVNVQLTEGVSLDANNGIFNSTEDLLPIGRQIYKEFQGTPPEQLVLLVNHVYFSIRGDSEPDWCIDYQTSEICGERLSRVVVVSTSDSPKMKTERMLVHEICHNLGCQHTPDMTYFDTPTEDCLAMFEHRGLNRRDPDWPYSSFSASIQEVGVDLTDPANLIIYPPETYDHMSYCDSGWVSPWTYKKVFDSHLLKIQ
jgi:hypothetical protein